MGRPWRFRVGDKAFGLELALRRWYPMGRFEGPDYAFHVVGGPSRSTICPRARTEGLTRAGAIVLPRARDGAGRGS